MVGCTFQVIAIRPPVTLFLVTLAPTEPNLAQVAARTFSSPRIAVSPLARGVSDLAQDRFEDEDGSGCASIPVSLVTNLGLRLG